MSIVILADVRYAYAVYAYLDANYAPGLPAPRVKLTREAAYSLVRDCPGIKGSWTQDILTLCVPPALQDEEAKP